MMRNSTTRISPETAGQRRRYHWWHLHSGERLLASARRRPRNPKLRRRHLTATKLVSGSPAAENVLAIDTCGRGKSFDPVVTALEITSGNRVQQRFQDILAAERYLQVIDGTPGLQWLEVNLNGHIFRLDLLAAARR